MASIIQLLVGVEKQGAFAKITTVNVILSHLGEKNAESRAVLVGGEVATLRSAAENGESSLTLVACDNYLTLL